MFSQANFIISEASSRTIFSVEMNTEVGIDNNKNLKVTLLVKTYIYLCSIINISSFVSPFFRSIFITFIFFFNLLHLKKIYFS